MHDELIDVVNEKDEVVGTAMKKQAYADKRTIRIAHVFIFNLKGDMALQLRSKNVSFCPEHWVTAGSGHVLAGETYLEAGVRELQEELGITVPLVFEGAFHYLQPDGMEKFLGAMRGAYGGAFARHLEDVEDVRWFTMEQVRELVLKGEKLHPEFEFLLRTKYRLQ